MLKTIIGLGLLLLAFITVDLMQLHGFGYIGGIIYLIVFTPIMIREIARLVRK